MSSLKIMLVSSEATPFAKTGGLADVAAALTRFLSGAGHDVRLVVPYYKRVADGAFDVTPVAGLEDVNVEFGGRAYGFSVVEAKLPASDAMVWFLRCPELFDRDKLYTEDDDEHLRFAFLSRACLTVCQWTQWAPDVVHCNDWHTGLTPLYLKAAYEWDELFARTKTILTIHNIGYQGVFDAAKTASLGIDEENKKLLYREDLDAGIVNFLKTGILYADVLTTVSRTYAEEIQTEEFGMGLEGLLRARSDALVGIVNGVDYGEWDPATDVLLEHRYTPSDLSGKAANKRALLEKFSLAPTGSGGDEGTETSDAPVFGIVSRFTGQKGFELLPDILPVLLREVDMRFVVLGSGEDRYEAYFQWLRDTFPEKVGIYRGYSEELAHRIEAGADAFLMPSRYEPCGLNQMYSLKYGTVPIVRRTGGLADTVTDYDPVTGEGTGFVFSEYTSHALLDAMKRALAAYRDRYTWRRIVEAGMACDYSWETQGERYVELYEALSR